MLRVYPDSYKKGVSRTLLALGKYKAQNHPNSTATGDTSSTVNPVTTDKIPSGRTGNKSNSVSTGWCAKYLLRRSSHFLLAAFACSIVSSPFCPYSINGRIKSGKGNPAQKLKSHKAGPVAALKSKQRRRYKQKLISAALFAESAFYCRIQAGEGYEILRRNCFKWQLICCYDRH